MTQNPTYLRTLTICRKVKVDRQGYAYNGAQYFGVGATLYYVELPSGCCGYVRAPSRAAAINEAIQRPGYWGIR